jgi:hypothetical protein
VVVRATDEELAAHEAALDRIEATGKGEPVWRNLER